RGGTGGRLRAPRGGAHAAAGGGIGPRALEPRGERAARQRCGVRTARDLTGPVGRGRRGAAARRVVRGGRGRRMNLRTFLPPLPIPVSAPPEPGEPARELPEPGLEPGRPSVVAFLRHTGCPFAEATARRLREAA